LFINLFADPILLSGKSRERAFVDGESGHEAARAGSVFVGGDTVQWQRRLQTRQGSTRGRGFVGACVAARAHRRASGVGSLSPGWLRRAAERGGGEADAGAGQRAGARVRVTRGNSFCF